MAGLESFSDGPPICTWIQGSRKFAIHIHPDLVGRLGTESWLAFKRLPHRGLEIGGILLGRIDSRDDATTFWIDGFEPVESEHRTGPSYILSEADFARLQAALSEKGTAAIGIYRSQTRSGLAALDESDSALFEKCFYSADALFLMLVPAPKVGAFFSPADGDLQCIYEFAWQLPLLPIAKAPQEHAPPRVDLHPGSSTDRLATPTQAESPNFVNQLDTDSADNNLDQQFRDQQFDDERWESRVRAENSTRTSESSSLLSNQRTTAAMRRQPATPVEDALEGNPGREKWPLIIAALLLSFIVGAVVNVMSSRRYSSEPDHPSYLTTERIIEPVEPSRPAQEHVRLTAERIGPYLRVVWDPTSATMRAATRGVLHIHEGTRQRDRDLTVNELNAGSIIVEPRSPEVTLQLDVYSPASNATGMVQVMNIPPRKAASQVAPDEDELRAKSAPRIQPATLVPAKPLTVLNEPRPSPAKTDETKQETRAANSGSNGDPNSNRIAADTKRVAPEVVPLVDKSEPKPAIAERTESPGIDRTPSVRVWTEPVPGSRLRQLVGKIGQIPLLRRFGKPAVVVAPVPKYVEQPALKMLNKQNMIEPVSVGVKVRVGDSGVVEEAKVVDYGNPPNRELADSALAAARHWTFEPMRSEDAATASEVILHFRFAP